MNVIALLTAIVSIAEVIINLTKEKVKEKIKPIIWSMGVLAVVSIGAIIFDFIFNNQTISPQYILEAIFVFVVSVFAPLVEYENVLETAKKIIETLKPVMKK